MIPSTVVHQAMYYEVDEASSDKWHVQGGCQQYANMVNDIMSANILYQPASMTITTVFRNPDNQDPNDPDYYTPM